MDKCIANQLRNVLPDDVVALVDANPDVTLRVRRSMFDSYGRILAENQTMLFENAAFARVAFTVHAWQLVDKRSVATLQLADVKLYTDFSIPRLHVRAKIHDDGFAIAFKAETSKGVFTDAKLNDYWVPGETLFLDNNLLVCQLLIPQVTALTNMLRVLMANLPETPQYALSFAKALKDYQLAKHDWRDVP